MTAKHILIVSIGPVQGFIATARRTRDLWFGSYLLSDLSRIAARTLKAHASALVFPGVDTVDLDNATLPVVNKISAIVADPNATQVAVYQAISQAWIEHAALARKPYQDSVAHWCNEPLWTSQLDDLIEFQWASMPIGASYATALEHAEALLDAAKTTRYFSASSSANRLPKSSLDPSRESIFTDKSRLPKHLVRKAQLTATEHLDSSGFVKRLGGNQEVVEQFTPTTRIALDPWIRAIPQDRLSEIRNHYDILVRHDLATRVKGNKNKETGLSVYAHFPFDGELLFPDQCEVLANNLKHLFGDADQDEKDAHVAVKAAVQGICKQRNALYQDFGAPSRYIALIRADGDNMGAALSGLTSIETHQAISKAITAFARSVPHVVQGKSDGPHGHCIYSGGDDVLALVPVPAALACAQALRDTFNQCLQAFITNDAPLSLSVGIAIAHMSEPLGVTRGFADEAEQFAKGGDASHLIAPRNAIALVIHPRSGSPITVSGNWGTTSEPTETISHFTKLFQSGAIPGGLPFEIQRFATHLTESSLARVLARRRESGGEDQISSEAAACIMNRFKQVGAQLLNELQASRWLASHSSLAG